MSFTSNLLYSAYYLKELDWKKASQYMEYVHRKQNRSKAAISMDIVYDVFKYNIGIMDYFLFRFYELSPEEKETWAGTGFMYEYHKAMNPMENRGILSNKIKFFQFYAPFVKHVYCTIDDLRADTGKFDKVLAATKKKIVVKDSNGQCGWGVEVLEVDKYSKESLYSYMKEKGFDLVESFVQQHSALNELSSSGLNTIRLITEVGPNKEVRVLGGLLRVSINSHVDNIAMGNIACEVDLQTGVLIGNGVYSDITKPEVENHPVTGKKLKGFKIPFWKEAIEMVKAAALYNTGNKSIGWDVAITDNGPSLIEGNHNWCKLLWQLPVKKGLKSRILEGQKA